MNREEFGFLPTICIICALVLLAGLLYAGVPGQSAVLVVAAALVLMKAANKMRLR
jgi:hypothetical protein